MDPLVSPNCAEIIPFRPPLRGHFWESLVFRLYSKLARSIIALKLSVTTTPPLQQIFQFTRIRFVMSLLYNSFQLMAKNATVHLYVKVVSVKELDLLRLDVVVAVLQN